MGTNVEIFNREGKGLAFVSKGVIPIIKSCQVKWRAYSCNEFKIELPVDAPLAEYAKADNIVNIKDCYFYIERVESTIGQSPVLVVQGKSLLGLINHRIVAYKGELYVNHWVASRLVYYLISDAITHVNYLEEQANGKINNLIVMDEMTQWWGNEVPPMNNLGGKTLEEVTKICEGYQIVLDERAYAYNEVSSYVTVRQGRDLSGEGGVEFTILQDTLVSEKYVQDRINFANIAVVYGEEDEKTKKRPRVIVKNGNPVSFDFREIYVDANDIKKKWEEDGKEIILTDQQYKDKLIQRGKEKLTEATEILEVSGEVNFKSSLFQYERDYQVGDIVRVTSERFKVSKSSVLTEMVETWDETGYHLDPTFDKSKNNKI